MGYPSDSDFEEARRHRAPPSHRRPDPLTFDALRQANRARLPHFKNALGQPAHSEPDGSDWSDAEWLQAVVGGRFYNISL